MTRILMHGCNGAMGRVISGLAKEMDNAQIVAGVDPFCQDSSDYPVFKTLEECNVDAIIVSDPAVIKEALDKFFDISYELVAGTEE